jgi:hypothetical protein
MKRTFKYALTAVLAAGLIVPAFAQDNFPDTPENHWAYEALAKLKKDGLLVGYPDGLFRGTRPASRYELAVAIHAVYTNLHNVTDGLQSQIDALKAAQGNSAEIQNLKDAIAALQAQVDAMKGYGDDIANLKKLTDTFQNELHGLGVDVDQLKKDLGDLAKRVTALEARKPAVDISGDASFFLAAGNSDSNNPGLNKDGRVEGILKTASGASTGATTAGLDKDFSVLHEAAFNVKGTNTTGPTWGGTIVVGNAVSDIGQSNGSTFNGSGGNVAGTGFGSAYGQPYAGTGQEEIYVQDFSVKFNSSVAGLGFNAEVGRVGYEVSPYIFQRLSPSTYFTNDRWDNGKFYLDGGVIGFDLLGAKIDIVGGQTSNEVDAEGMNINPVVSGPYGGPLGTQVLNIDRTLGVTLSAPITSAGSVKLAYLWLEGDPTPTGDQTFGATNSSANRLEVFGGNLNFALGVIKLQGDYSKSNLKMNNTTVNSSDNDAWQAKASYGTGTWGIYGLYREIGPLFMAPGDWGRIGIIRNPTNLKGFNAGGNINFTPGLVLKGDYEHDETLDNGYGAASVFDSGTKLDKYNVTLGYRFTSNLDVSVGYENDKFSNIASALGATGDPQYQWTTFGIGYGLSDAAKLTLQYELSDVSNEFVLPYLASQGGGTAPTRYKGGFLSSQLTVKF